MKILILGGDGMLGHQCLKAWRTRHDVRVTLHRNLASYERYGLFDQGNACADIDVRAIDRVAEVFAGFRPDAVVNAAGIVKHRPQAAAVIPSLETNSLLPHRLAILCRLSGARLVHVSTDCVFSGRKGNYAESDAADAEDLYGRSKYLGEVGESRCLTLRTSIIGRELGRKTGLLEWFLAQREGTVKGFRKAIFTGFTTIELARIIERLLIGFPHGSGIYHVSSEPISKFDLLHKLNDALQLGVTILPDDDFCCDRSLDSTRFRSEFGYAPPSWDDMVEELGAQG